MVFEKIDKKTALELFKIQIIGISISFSFLMLTLVLLWHWNYFNAFWIFLAIGAFSYISNLYVISKLSRRIFN